MAERAGGDPRPLEALLECQPSFRPRARALRRAALSGAPILLTGEGGTGRSTLARALHGISGRAPLVETEVGLIQASLFEGELFGYVKGAFTGAERSRRGLVRRAEGGTLVLDRVEDMPVALQPKLLRLVAEQRYAPLGGRETGCDVRFVAIASEELPERIRSGAFREDLYYRLEVLAFEVPPLRERRGDLEPLIDALLADAAERYGKPGLELDSASREWMESHRWPGNLRELRNCIERAAVLHEDGPLTVPLPRRSQLQRPKSLEEVEAEAVRSALRFTRGHQGRAAEVLGISRKTLWEKRKRYGLR